MSCIKLHRLVLSILALIFFGSLSSYASAEIIDDITVHTDPNGDVEAVVKFTVPIQYLRHFPQGKSPITSIFFNVLGNVPADEWRDYETHRTPPSDLVKEISITTRDLGTGPKIQVKFFRPAEFSVRMGDNNQVLLIHVKPDTQQKKDESKPAASQTGGTPTPVAALPAVVPTIAKAPIVVPSVPVPAVTASSAKPTVATATPVATPSAPVPADSATTAKPAVTAAAPTPAAPLPSASAPTTKPSVTSVSDGVIDNITVHSDSNGEVDAEVRFTAPVHYLRRFPLAKTPSTSIYFDTPASSSDKWKNYESHTALPSDIVQEITVSTRDRNTGPKVTIKLYQPAEFAVTTAKNGQTLLIHIKGGVPQRQNESKAASGSGGAIIPLPVLPMVVPAIAIAPSVAAPTVAVPTVSTAKDKPLTAVAAAPVEPAPVAAAPVAVAPVAPAPVVSVAPSGDVTAPKVVLAQSQLKPIHIALGGKDGLPPFPDIDQVGPQGNAPLSDKPTLAERITKANNQAAALMVSGGNALLTGQTFEAVESFNKVLNLPPNKYTQDAQLWIAIARERLGQHAKAMLEFNAYLKLYPDGKMAMWVKERLDRLKTSQPALFIAAPPPVIVPVKAKNTEFQYSEFGSLSMYFYTGASQTNTTATVGAGATQAPTSLSRTDQKSLMTNINMTARSFNNEYDNRLVIQDFYAANFLAGQQNSNRLGAAYYEMKDRVENYSFKVGRQSGFGGGVMGRFDGIVAGYGASQNWKANFVTGQLSDVTIDAKPKFNGVSLDFGLRNSLGGSVYFINQTVSGITDRRAVGGDLRYFDQRFNIMSMLDYDVQFKALNMFTLQGTLLGGGTGTDYNFLVDRRRGPVLDVRNAINGTPIPFASLTQGGFTFDQLISLADQRTSVSSTAQVGMTNHLTEKWLVGTDFTISDTAGLPRSGGDTSFICNDPLNPLNPGNVNTNTPPTEGCLDATASTGNIWTISERMTGMGVIRARDMTNFSVSFTKGQHMKAESFQASNHVDLQEKWTLDSSMRLSLQSGDTGGKSTDLSPTFRLAYRVRNNLTADGQLGLDWNKTTVNIVQPDLTTVQSSSTSFREFISFGFQLSF